MRPQASVSHIFVILFAIRFAIPCPTAGADPIKIADVSRGEAVSFEKEILPLMRRSCLACHSASERQGELVLESPTAMRKGGDSGPALIPGRGADSLLLKLAAHQDDPAMPPEGNDVNAPPLTSEELGLLRLWIDQGARGSDAVASLSPGTWQSLPARVGPIYAVAVSEDGQIVAASRSNQLYLYHVPTGRAIARLADDTLLGADQKPAGVAHRDLVQSLAFNRDGDLLASGSFREVKLWRKPSDVTRQSLATAEAVSAACAGPNGQHVATASGNAIQVWDETGKVIATCTGHSARVTGVRITSDSQTLVSSSMDGTLRTWNLADGKPVGMVEIGTPLLAVELVATASPTDEVPHPEPLIVTGGEDRLVHVVHMPRQPRQSIADLAGPLRHAVASRDGQTVALLSNAGKLQLLAHADRQWQTLATADLKDLGIAAADVSSLAIHAAVDGAAATERTGGVLLIGTTDGGIHLWSVAEKQLIDRWQSDVATTSLAIAGNGNQAATGHTSGLVQFWNLATKAPLVWERPAGSAAATAVARSLNGAMLAEAVVIGGKPVILVRNAADGKILHQFPGHTARIGCLSFSVDSARLVSAADNGVVFVWNLAASNAAPEFKVEGQQIEGQGSRMDAACLAGDNAHVFFAIGNVARMVKLADSSLVHEFKGHTNRITSLALGPDSLPFTVSLDNTVRVWNPADGQQARTFNVPSPASAVAQTADRQRLAVAGVDRQIRIFQLTNGQLLQTLPAPSGSDQSSIVQLAFTADAKQLVTVSSDGQAKQAVGYWDLASTPPRCQETLRDVSVSQAFPAPQANQLLMADDKGSWHQRELRLQRSVAGLTKPIRRATYASGDQTLLVLCEDGNFRGVNAGNGQVTFSTAHGAVVHDLAMSSDGQLLATAGVNKVVRLWQANGAPSNPSQIANLPAEATAVAFSRDGQQVIIATADKQVGVYDRATGGLIERFNQHQDAPLLLLVAAEEQSRQVTSLSSESGWVWKLHGVRNIAGHTNSITSLAAVPTAPRQVVSGGLDATARHWNLDTGQLIRQFSHGGPVTSVAVRPDGQRVATASDNKTARLWNISGQQIAQLQGDLRAQTRVTRLTQQERAATARVNVAKQQWEAAQKDTPQKAEAEKKAAEALAKANQDVKDKQTELDKVAAMKVEAERLAIETSAKARQAQIAKSEAEDRVKAATEVVTKRQSLVTQLTALANAAADDEALKKRLADAQAAVTAAQADLQDTQKAVPELTKALQAAVNEANQATQKATAQQKPYNDALAALATAQSAQNLAAQQHVIAARELKTAQELEPTAKTRHVQLEQALADVKAALETAKQAATAAELPIRSIAFSPDGTVLATAGDFSAAHTWDAEKGTPLAAYAGHSQPISVALFLDNDRLLTGSADKTARVWELNPQWRLEKTLGGIDQPAVFSHRVLALDFSADATQLLVGGGIPSRNGELSIFNVADGKRTFYLPQAHDDVIHAARFSPDGKRIASAGADKYVRTFDLASSQQLRRFEGHTNYVLGLAWKGDGQTLASSAADNTVKIWDAETGDQRRTISNFNKHVTSIAFVGESDTIVSSCGDRSVRMHNSANGGNVRSFGGADSWVHCVDIVPNSTVLAAGTASGALKLWNGTNGQVLQTIQVGEVEETN